MRNKNNNESKRWLKQSEDDLKVAKWSLKGKFYWNTCFMCQQSGEKALKSFLYFKGERSVFGHSLLELYRKSKKYNSEFSKIEKDCKQLDKYYTITRYPDGLPSLTPSEYFEKEESEQAIKYTEKIIEIVKQCQKSS